MRQSHKKRQAPQPTPNRRIEGTTAFLFILSNCGPSPSIKCTKLGINHYPFLLNFAVRIVLALAPLQTLGRRNVRGFPRPRLPLLPPPCHQPRLRSRMTSVRTAGSDAHRAGADHGGWPMSWRLGNGVGKSPYGPRFPR